MRLILILGGSLRYEGGDGRQESVVDLSPGGSRVGDLVAQLLLPPERVKLILVNGRGATFATPLQEGDRVAFFPPELSFNTFVSLSFRKENVEKRNPSSSPPRPPAEADE
jgi:molybdopterin converting factor small subunit